MLRRDFFKRTGQSLAALWALQTTIGRRANAATTQPQAGGANITVHDDAFWAQVRDAFPLTRKNTYLNTGGLGARQRYPSTSSKIKSTNLKRSQKPATRTSYGLRLKTRPALYSAATPTKSPIRAMPPKTPASSATGCGCSAATRSSPSTHEHVGNIVSWVVRHKRNGIVVKTFTPSTRSAQENVERIGALSISHVTCATSQILPIKTIGELAAPHGIWYFVDGAQAPGMLPVDVRDVGCRLRHQRPQKAAWPQGHRPALRAPLFAGLGAFMQFLLGIDNIWRRNHALGAMLIKELNELGAEIVSPQDKNEHGSIVTFRLYNMPYSEFRAS